MPFDNILRLTDGEVASLLIALYCRKSNLNDVLDENRQEGNLDSDMPYTSSALNTTTRLIKYIEEIIQDK